jgi:hypothetical protein
MICFENIKTVKEAGGVKIKGLNDDDRFDEHEQGKHITKTPIGISSPKAGEPYHRSCH